MSVETGLFCPQQFITLAVGTASAAAAQTITQTFVTQNSSPLYKLRILNASNGVSFVQWGGTSVIATTTTGYPVAAGAETIINMGSPCQGVSAIAGTGTGNVYVSPG